MKIIGDHTSQFTHYKKEPGLFFGYNDVLEGEEKTVRAFSFSRRGFQQIEKTVTPKLYIHLFNSQWSYFTGKLREYLLPWRWKVAYLQKEDGKIERILVCTSIDDASLSPKFNETIGKTLLGIQLSKLDVYGEFCGHEYIYKAPDDNKKETDYKLMHIFRRRGPLSSLKYAFLKRFSFNHKEVTFHFWLYTGPVSEKILIECGDINDFQSSGFLTPFPLKKEDPV